MGREVVQMKISKLYKIYWQDPVGEINTTLDRFLKIGLAQKITVGWLVFEDDDKIVLAMERNEKDNFSPDMSGDFTMVNKGIITHYELLKEKTNG